MAFLIGAHVCQSDRVLLTRATSAHLPRRRSLLPLIGQQLQIGWMMSYMITGAGDVWYVTLSSQVELIGWTGGGHFLTLNLQSEIIENAKHRSAVSDQTLIIQCILINDNQRVLIFLSILFAFAQWNFKNKSTQRSEAQKHTCNYCLSPKGSPKRTKRRSLRLFV